MKNRGFGVAIFGLLLFSPANYAHAQNLSPTELQELLTRMKADPRLQPVFDFYKQVDEEAQMENLARDPAKLQAIAEHPALYATHGSQHVQDIALKSVEFVQAMNGVHFEKREGSNFLFMQSLEFALGLLHDIGMHNLSLPGRAVHPDFATQFMFSEQGRQVATALFEILPGVKQTLAHTYPNAGAEGQLAIFQQMLAMSNTHSKSRVPTDDLNDLTKLAAREREVAATPLQQTELALRRKKAKSPAEAQTMQPDANLGNYDDLSAGFRRQFGENGAGAFGFLTEASTPEQRAFLKILTDDARILAIADASRKRGVNLRASGYHPISLDAEKGSAIVSLHVDDQVTLRMRTNSPYTVGEAKIHDVYIGEDGNFHISLEPGKIGDAARSDVAKAVGFINNDIYKDVFGRLDFGDGVAKNYKNNPSGDPLHIVIDAPQDDPGFGQMIKDLLSDLKQQGITDVMLSASPPPQPATLERAQFEAAQSHLSEHDLVGIKSSLIDHGFDASGLKSLDGCRILTIKPGEKLLEAGTESPYVYIPLDAGLNAPRGQDAGGDYRIKPWILIGEQGVVRKAQRSVNVINASGKSVPVIAIPKEVFQNPATGWERIYTPAEASKKLADYFEAKELHAQASATPIEYTPLGPANAGYFDYRDQAPDDRFRRIAFKNDIAKKSNNILFLNFNADTTPLERQQILKSLTAQRGKIARIVLDYRSVDAARINEFAGELEHACGATVTPVIGDSDTRSGILNAVRANQDGVVSLGDGVYYATKTVLKGRNMEKFVNTDAVPGNGYAIPADVKAFVQASPRSVEGHITNRDTGNALEILGISEKGAALVSDNRSYLVDSDTLAGGGPLAPMNHFEQKSYVGPSVPALQNLTAEESRRSPVFLPKDKTSPGHQEPHKNPCAAALAA